MIKDLYVVDIISAKIAKQYIHKYHYSKGSHNGPSPCYGLFEQDILIGVLMFATPCSEYVRASIFGKDRKDEVTELHRLHIQDGTPKNTESWFISRCLKKLKTDKPRITGVVSFADPTSGHMGIIYQACNAIYYGRSNKERFYFDQSGRLRHKRQSGRNISVKEAESKGWTSTWRDGKYRYLFLVPNNKFHRQQLLKDILVTSMGYPK